MTSLLVFGEQHNFSDLEIKELTKDFESIDFMQCNALNIENMIKQFNLILHKENAILVVLNNKVIVPSEFMKYLSNFNKKNLNYISIQNFMELHLLKCFVPLELTDISFLEKHQPFTQFQLFLKLFIDYTLSITIFLLASPVMLYAIYKIRKESPGPIIFKQKRIGLKGKEFTCFKFRSMQLDAEKDGEKFASENDKRVYSWGKTMRSTRIDELPQLWNVLRRDMHLIGPRPERRVWIKQFEKEIPYYNERHSIKPGLTGWAQVLYPYGENAYDAKQKLMYDLYYIKHWSLWLELKTTWKTIIVILSRKGL